MRINNALANSGFDKKAHYTYQSNDDLPVAV